MLSQQITFLKNYIHLLFKSVKGSLINPQNLQKRLFCFFSALFEKVKFEKARRKFLCCSILLFLFFSLSSVLFSVPAFGYRIKTELRINVPSRTLHLYKAGRLIHEYPVGVGNSKQFQTPPGIYQVEKKIINPVWEHPYKPDGQVRVGTNSKNPLGSRWIGFHKEGSGVYGIHGTNQPNSVGKFVSHGCVRMHNEDVEEIFELVDYGTPVVVSYSRFYLERVGNTITIEVFPDPYRIKDIKLEEVIAKIRKIHPFAEIDFGNLRKAIEDISETQIYEVAFINYRDLYGSRPVLRR